MLKELHYSWEQIAEVLMISRTTLWRRFRDLGVPTSRYTELSNTELDSIMTSLVQRFPNNGVTLIRGLNGSLNICISRNRIHDSLLRVSNQLSVYFDLPYKSVVGLVGCDLRR